MASLKWVFPTKNASNINFVLLSSTFMQSRFFRLVYGLIDFRFVCVLVFKVRKRFIEMSVSESYFFIALHTIDRPLVKSVYPQK